MGQYTREPSPFGGPARYTNPGMVAAIATYCAIMRIQLRDFYVTQGSFNVGVPASKGTHDKADCIDVPTSVNEWVLKLIGVVAWTRAGARWKGNEHSHLVRLFSTALAWLAAAQARAYIERGTDGTGDLSTPDVERMPRYRAIRHVSGPTSVHYVVKRATWSAHQPGGHPDDRRRPLPVGTVIDDVAGIVSCRGVKYLVTAPEVGVPVFTSLGACAALQRRGAALPKGTRYRVTSDYAPARPAPFVSAPVIPRWGPKRGDVVSATRRFGPFRRVSRLRWLHVSHLDHVK